MVVLLPQFFSRCTSVVMAIMFPTDFTPEVHEAMDRFMSCLALSLSGK